MTTLNAAFEDLLRPHLPHLDPSAPITDTLVLRDAGLDSLSLIELLVALEDTYGIEVPDDLLVPETFRTPASLWDVVAALRDAP